MADVIRENHTESEILQGTLEKGREKEIYFTTESNDYATYQSDKAEISSYASTLKKLIELSFIYKTITTKGMRSRMFDTGKFPEAASGVGNIYEQRKHINSNHLALGVLVDESGSMHGSNIEAARICATLFNDAFQKSPWVEIFVYGHSSDIFTGLCLMSLKENVNSENSLRILTKLAKAIIVMLFMISIKMMLTDFVKFEFRMYRLGAKLISATLTYS